MWFYRTNGASGATDPPPKPFWRDVLKVHPAAELFPLMSEPELRELANDIKKNGLQDQPVLYRDPKLGICVLDGRNRLDACELNGRETVYPSGTPKVGVIREWSSSFDPVDYVLTKNLYRRHLTAEQRRELIAKVLKARPEKSNNQIAKEVKVDDKTVAKVRANLESRSEIPNVGTRTDSKGRQQPATKPVKAKKKSILTTVPPASIKAATDIEPASKAATTIELEIEREWSEAERAFEVLTSRTVAQVATAISPGKAALVTEFADFFAELKARLTTRPNGNDEAPGAGSDYSIPDDDLSIPHFLQRGAVS